MTNRAYEGNIELHIDELVLHGFSPGERHRIGDAIRQELLRQLSEGGLPNINALSRFGGVSRLNAGAIQVIQGAGPESIGRQVARAVHGSVAGGRQQAGRARPTNGKG